MKKLLFAAVMLLMGVAVAQAQAYKPFRFGITLGYANPSGGGDAKGGVLFNLEPSYRVQDNIAVGLRLEVAAMARAVANSTGASGSVSGNASYTVNGQYFFSNNTFRPFAGLGLGIYNLASVSGEATSGTASSSIAGGTKFGFYPRVGFELGHFVLGIDYNIIP